MNAFSPNAGVAGRDDSDDSSLEGVFGLLADQRRRDVLACLADNTQSVALTELAQEVAVRENERPLTEISTEEVRTIRTSLYHHHLPKLEDAGAVEYDQDRALIRASASAEMVDRVRSRIADGEGKR